MVEWWNGGMIKSIFQYSKIPFLFGDMECWKDGMPKTNIPFFPFSTIPFFLPLLL